MKNSLPYILNKKIKIVERGSVIADEMFD